MRHALPYHPELGTRLRRLARPQDRAVWLRPGTPAQELFAAFPSEIISLTEQSVGGSSESTASIKEGGPAKAGFWTGMQRLVDKAPRPDGLDDLPFRGGLLGFIGYGQSPSTAKRHFPSAYMGLYSSFVWVDHLRQKAEFIRVDGACGIPSEWRFFLEDVNRITGDSLLPSPFRLLRPFAALTPPELYRAHFQRIQHYLHQGDCYQVNYAQAFVAGCEGSGADALERLLQASQPAHAGWLTLPEGEVLCLSPELFLQVQAGRITTRPIKGTAPRAAEPAQDRHLRQALQASPKNRAENLMIVDLLRHDLGRHAETGSVQVERLFEVESLPQVHHLVSTITGQLKKSSHVVELIRDCFPGGSITGAPKKRAMEIIAELEPTPRSVYCGSIGFINGDGDVLLNIAIRTLLRLDDEIYAWAGGGIVADSDCDAEYQECFHKMGALMKVLEAMR